MIPAPAARALETEDADERANEIALCLLAEVRINGQKQFDETGTNWDGMAFSEAGMALIRELTK